LEKERKATEGHPACLGADLRAAEAGIFESGLEVLHLLWVAFSIIDQSIWHMSSGAYRPMDGGDSDSIQPVDLGILLAPKEPKATVEVLVNKIIANEDASGLKVVMWPQCFELVFCLGCFTSTSMNVVFDSKDKSVAISTWGGYLCCSPCITSNRLQYQDVANFAIRATGGSTTYGEGTPQHHYHVVLVTKDRTILVVSGEGFRSEAQVQAKVLYNFVFTGGCSDVAGIPKLQTAIPMTLHIASCGMIYCIERDETARRL
jgi:hypothetical protein